MTTEREDLVRRLRAILAAGHTAAYDLRNDIETELASDFPAPSSPEECEKLLREIVEAYDTRKLYMRSWDLVDESGTYQSHDWHDWHDEWLTHARRALAARAAQEEQK